jgi:DNA-binding MarR family transcriptional regulator
VCYLSYTLGMADATLVADRLHSAAIHLLRKVRREDAGSGLSAARLSALSVIVYAGPLTLGRLAEAEQVRSPTMTRIVDQLVEDGLAERESVPADGRRTLVRATAAGVNLTTEGRRRRVASLVGDLESLRPEDLATLARAAELLETIVGRSHP